ncbi:ATP-grasp domain-containing protein [Halocatena marina]|uniref:RimK family alpha-L-glutamate ligase n=1 Tax=Halocatena marina TaxID=2934937 RepID=A0ABD5YY85_9EURY|nr:RimK family alpha-L-glutamate ligase [Halocatena marina]
MLRLAVTTAAQTYERIREPLEAREIAVDYVQADERTVDLSADESESFDVGFVYPSRLPEGGVVDALLDVPWVNDREAILRSRHKAETLARLGRAGVPTPETVMVSNPIDQTDARGVFERFEPPVVIKPNSTTRGTGITKVSDLDSFLGTIDYLELVHGYPTTADKSYLVQEYLPDARDYRAMIIDGQYAGAVERRLPDDTGRWKHNVHRGAQATSVSLPSEYRRIAEQTAAALNIPYLGVDLLVSEDRALVTETNARPTVDDEAKYEPSFYDELAQLIRDQA